MPDVVTWGRSAGAYARVVRLADTAQNRAYLASAARTDGTPSAVVKLGQDIALLSGDGIRTVSRLANTPTPVINRGDTVQVDGLNASVLMTDDGFDEIDASCVVVAVIDTGVDVNHPALRGRLVQGYNSFDHSANVIDVLGHGTHVAGTIVGADTMQQGAGGVATSAKVMPIRACDPNGHFSDNGIADGIVYAVQHGAKIINISLEDKGALPRTTFAIEYARRCGVLVVVAAGNEGANQVDNPASAPGALAVGSSVNGRRSSFSNGGPRLDVTAPGENVLAPTPNATWGYKSGTSMATPYVAGAAALVMARHPEWNVEQVRAHLEQTAADYGARGKDDAFGYGQINLMEAVYGGPPPSVRNVVQQPAYNPYQQPSYPQSPYQQPQPNWFQRIFNR